MRTIFSDKTVAFLIEKAEPYLAEKMSELAKETILNTLEDEEIAGAVIQYGDALYDRYQKKFWGQIGGMQKGLNYAAEKANPLAEIIDSEGNISLANIIRGVLSGGFKSAAAGQSGLGPTGSRRKILKYQ